MSFAIDGTIISGHNPLIWDDTVPMKQRWLHFDQDDLTNGNVHLKRGDAIYLKNVEYEHCVVVTEDYSGTSITAVNVWSSNMDNIQDFNERSIGEYLYDKDIFLPTDIDITIYKNPKNN